MPALPLRKKVQRTMSYSTLLAVIAYVRRSPGVQAAASVLESSTVKVRPPSDEADSVHLDGAASGTSSVRLRST